MIDYFALMNEPRRPWVDLDSLKQRFLALSAEQHPDRVHQAGEAERSEAQRRFTELNAAYRCLREPKDRLLHLLELELGMRPDQIQRIPPDLMDLSMAVAENCRKADEFLQEKAKTVSPILQVGLFERAQEFVEKLTTLQKNINNRQESLMEELKALDAGWENLANSETQERRAILRRLEEVYRLLSYFGRWAGQIQDRIVRLSI